MSEIFSPRAHFTDLNSPQSHQNLVTNSLNIFLQFSSLPREHFPHQAFSSWLITLLFHRSARAQFHRAHLIQSTSRKSSNITATALTIWVFGHFTSLITSFPQSQLSWKSAMSHNVGNGSINFLHQSSVVNAMLQKHFLFYVNSTKLRIFFIFFVSVGFYLVGHTKGTILIGIENNGALLQLESMSYNWIREPSPLPAISSPSSIMHRLRLLISPWWLNTKSSSIALFAVWLKFSKNSLIFFSKLKLLLSIKYRTMLSLKLHLIYDLTTDEALVTSGKHLICSEFSHTIFRELLLVNRFFFFPHSECFIFSGEVWHGAQVTVTSHATSYFYHDKKKTSNSL